MANTIFIYNQPEMRHTACMMGSIVSMSKYAPCRSDIDFSKYGRIVIVAGDPEDIPLLAGKVREHCGGKWLGFVAFSEEPCREWLHEAEQLLGRTVDFSVFAGMDNLTENSISAAESLTTALRKKENNDEAVLMAMESFLKAHNTCVLATGWGTDVRTTVIEYVYHGKKVYLFSEGGDKFRNLYRNPNVSLSVFEPFTGFPQLAGLRIDGTARIIEPDDSDYFTAAAAKGIARERLEKMPVVLHVVEISPSTAVFLWGEFIKQGKAPRQVYRFI